MPRPKRNLHATVTSTLTPPSTLPPTHTLAQITAARGNNLYSAILANNDTDPANDTKDAAPVLVELEAKFRSTIWIKRGSYVVVDTAALAERGNKIGGVVVNVVRDEREWRRMGYWPAAFARKSTYVEEDSEEEESTVGKMPPSEGEEEEKGGK